MEAAPNSKVYAVAIGRKTGVFHTWEEYASQVRFFPASKSRCFHSVGEADRYLNQETAPLNRSNATTTSHGGRINRPTTYETVEWRETNEQETRRHSTGTNAPTLIAPTLIAPTLIAPTLNPYANSQLWREKRKQRQQQQKQQRYYQEEQHRHQQQTVEFSPDNLDVPPVQVTQPDTGSPTSLYHGIQNSNHLASADIHPTTAGEQTSRNAPPNPSNVGAQRDSLSPERRKRDDTYRHAGEQALLPGISLRSTTADAVPATMTIGATTLPSDTNAPALFPVHQANDTEMDGQALTTSGIGGTIASVSATLNDGTNGGTCTTAHLSVTLTDSGGVSIALDLQGRGQPRAQDGSHQGTGSNVEYQSDENVLPANMMDHIPPPGILAAVKKETENVRLLLKHNSVEVFFCAVLRTSVQEFAQSHSILELSYQVWAALCARANLPVPPTRIQPVYEKLRQREHFTTRAAFVLEEVRQAISHPLAERWYPERDHPRASPATRAIGGNTIASLPPGQTARTIAVQLDLVEPQDHGISIMILSVPSPRSKFSKAEAECLTYGVVVECTFGTSDRGRAIAGSILGWVMEANRKKNPGTVTIAVYRSVPLVDETVKSRWILRPVCSCVGFCRQFVALTDYAEQVPFLDALLGKPPGELATKDETKVLTMTTSHENADKTEVSKVAANLNAKQREAMDSFLNSEPNSITIIQGPPGTGKSTLLVATIRKWLDQCRSPETTDTVANRPCLLVCAPTNKAVFVLIERLMKREDSCQNIKVAIVGDSKRLLGENPKESTYYQYCANTWKTLILDELTSIQSSLSPIRKATCLTCTRERVKDLQDLFSRRLRNVVPEFMSCMAALCLELSRGIRKEMHRLAKQAQKSFSLLNDDAVKSDFLQSADVIFSTLCSSGNADMRLVGGVPTLIVDEAAAATEPDLYVPFHVRPTRMLIVGDPKQLPSVVLSDRAKRCGLDMSLHERLMHYCKAKHTMLDTQYRMDPSICDFPSRQFYDGLLGTSESVSLRATSNKLLCDGRPFVFLHVNGTEHKASCGSLYNDREAETVLELVQSIPSDRVDDPDKFRVITFYAKQVACIREKLDEHGFNQTMVSTVDSSQGCESDIVVVSFVRSEKAGFLTDDRRMNVALTRARFQIVCVGNIERFPLMADQRCSTSTIQNLRKHALTNTAVVVSRKRNATTHIQARSCVLGSSKRGKPASTTIL